MRLQPGCLGPIRPRFAACCRPPLAERDRRSPPHAHRKLTQKLADEIKKPISVCHFPPGTSKWNKIEHRLFSFITKNWRGKPLISHQVIVSLIGATTTKTGLKVRAEIDPNTYPKGLKIRDAEMATLNITRDEFHGEWNYTLKPRA
jgi:hypothetical protein